MDRSSEDAILSAAQVRLEAKRKARAQPDPLALQRLCSAFWWFAGVRRTFEATIPGEPKAKERPRFAHARAYRRDRAAEDAIAWPLRQAYAGPPLEGFIGLVCVFYRSTLRRWDADNGLKLVADAGNGLVWLDDSQIKATLALLELDRENPRTVVVWGEREGS